MSQRDDWRRNLETIRQIRTQTCDVHWIQIGKEMQVEKRRLPSEEDVGMVRYLRRRRGRDMPGDCPNCLAAMVLGS